MVLWCCMLVLWFCDAAMRQKLLYQNLMLLHDDAMMLWCCGACWSAVMLSWCGAGMLWCIDAVVHAGVLWCCDVVVL